MKRSELVEIAKKNGTVMWLRSGTIEHLHIARKGGVVLARKLKQPKVQPIFNRALHGKPLSTKTEANIEFNCIELDPISKLPITPQPNPSLFRRLLEWLTA